MRQQNVILNVILIKPILRYFQARRMRQNPVAPEIFVDGPWRLSKQQSDAARPQPETREAEMLRRMARK
jgi:hypothetical protein